MLKRNGVDAGIVDAGGDLRAFGKKPDGEHWTIGIRHPEKPGEIITRFSIEEGAVATSGNYERFFSENGKQYHHILNPQTGYPANKCISVTIRTNNATMADALATAVFVLGPEEGMQLINQLAEVEGIIIYEDFDSLQYIVSNGLIGKFNKIE